MLDNSGSLLPVIVGVTGHRTIAPAAVTPVAEAVRTIFRNLRIQLPTTPIVLLSPLAEGADRLVAGVFLEELGDDPANRLLIPLPMPPHDYKNDFATADSRAEFDRLAARGTTLVLPQHLPSAYKGDAREVQYEQVGILIARSVHLMLALWDGQPSRGRGGTHDIVQYKLDGVPTPAWLRPSHLDLPEAGPVYHIVTPRDDRPLPHPAGKRIVLLPTEWHQNADHWGDQVPFMDDVDSFNHDAALMLRDHPDEVEKSIKYLWPDDPTLPVLDPMDDHIRNVYGVADALAVHFQKRSSRVMRWLLLLGISVICMGQVYSIQHELNTALLYLATLAAAASMLGFSNRARHQERYFGYRALAEGLRVQFFWRLAGIDRSVTDSYLRVQRDELQSVRQALRFADLDMAITEPDASHAEHRLAACLSQWVADQRKYFIGDGNAGAYKRDRLQHDLITRRKKWMFVAGACIMVGLVSYHIAVAAFIHSLQPPTDDQISVMILLGSVLLAGSASYAAYGEVLGLEEHARAAKKMGDLFARAEKRLAQSVRSIGEAEDELERQRWIEESRSIVHEMGVEALAENGDWVILHRDRPWQFTPA